MDLNLDKVEEYSDLVQEAIITVFEKIGLEEIETYPSELFTAISVVVPANLYGGLNGGSDISYIDVANKINKYALLLMFDLIERKNNENNNQNEK